MNLRIFYLKKKNIHSPTHRIHGTGIFAYIYHKKWTIHEGIHILESYGSPTAPFHPSNQPTSTQRIIIQPHRYPSTRKVCPTFRWCLSGRFGDLRPSPLVVTWDPGWFSGAWCFFFLEWGPSPFCWGLERNRFLIKLAVLKKRRHPTFEAPKNFVETSCGSSFNPWEAHNPKHGSRRRNYHLHRYWP